MPNHFFASCDPGQNGQGRRTLLCGDLFTQGGSDLPPITESDILGPSEASRHGIDHFSHMKNAHVMLERLAANEPTTLACMHGSAWSEAAASSRYCTNISMGNQVRK